MAIGLLDLPNELLLHLGEVAPTSVLNSLILTNRRLAQLLNPVLWQLGENAAQEDMSLEATGLPMALLPVIDSAEELFSYAVSTNNLPMLRKALRHSRLDYHNDPDTTDHAFQMAVDAGRHECVHLLLTAMEEQYETFSEATVLATVHSAMDQNDLATTQRLLQHGRISKKKWIDIGKHAMKCHNEQLLRIVLDSSSHSNPAPGQADLNHLLHYAAIFGHVPSVALLLERGAGVTMPGLDDLRFALTTPMHIAARRNNMDALAWMINHGANINTTVTAEAIGKLPVVDLFTNPAPDLCSKHCDGGLYPPPSRSLPTGFGAEARDFDHCILSLAFSTSPQTISQLLDQLDIPQIGEEILFRTAAWRGNKLLLQELHDRGISFAARRENNTVLHCIAGNDARYSDEREHNLSAAEFLLDVRPESLHEAGKDGNTPLHMAFWSLQVDMITEMMKRGASPYVPNNCGVTPIRWWPDYWGDRSQQMFSQYL